MTRAPRPAAVHPLARAALARAALARRALTVGALTIGALTPGAACGRGTDAASAATVTRPADLMATTAPPLPTAATAPVLRVALNEHLRSVLARSSVRLDPAQLGDAAVVMFTEPTQVLYDDPRDPRFNFAVGTGRFVALDQAAGWVYGVNATPQDRAAALDETVAVARQLERTLAGTAWRQDREPPWSPGPDTVAVWARGQDAELPVARFTAGPATVQLTLKRTGAPTPSERVAGKTTETFYVNVGITDLSRLDAYQARLLRARRARGNASTPLPLSAFMSAADLP